MFDQLVEQLYCKLSSALLLAVEVLGTTTYNRHASEIQPRYFDMIHPNRSILQHDPNTDPVCYNDKSSIYIYAHILVSLLEMYRSIGELHPASHERLRRHHQRRTSEGGRIWCSHKPEM